ncbi:MAG TPA: class I SAM-dependent methyltransferase [Steroidobacteraceae bacterium]|nr:class I SAM-dependent methyltransferase [Steroidobacteraceae bacterium]
MTTLTTPPLAPLLARLSADAAASTEKLRQERAKAPADAGALGPRSGDYRTYYARMKEYHLAVSPQTGTLLYMLARGSAARTVVEFGTSFGISTLHIAAALKDNGGGRLITTEFEPSKIAHARNNLRAANLQEFVEIREGDALETLARDIPPIDLVLLDGAKPLYLKVLNLLEPHLRSGAMLVADNADWCPEYLERVRTAANGYLSVPFGADVELSMRLT